jgi:hypothetical protein
MLVVAVGDPALLVLQVVAEVVVAEPQWLGKMGLLWPWPEAAVEVAVEVRCRISRLAILFQSAMRQVS